MESKLPDNFFVGIAKLYSQLNKLKKKDEDVLIKFALYIDKELGKTGGDGNGAEIII